MSEWKAEFIHVQLAIDLDVTPAARGLIAALTPEPWPSIVEWRAGYDDDRAEMRNDSVHEYLERETFRNLEWNHGAQFRGQIGSRAGRSIASLFIEDTEIEHCWRWLVACEELVHRLASDPRSGLAVARVQRSGAGARCIPELLAIGGQTHVHAARDEVYAPVFDDIDAGIAAGKWDARRIGEHRVLARAMHAETNVELLAAIWDGQWAMARLARPGACSFNFAYDVEPEEMPIFKRGERRLLSVGHDEAARTSIYSCLLEPGQHVAPWEIWTLGMALKRKRLPSGEAVDAIRVVFADEASAMRERRPLLAAGVTVQCYGTDGKVKTLPQDR
ncbi:MAG: hypothetical protein K8M05_10915 [Deltaproteobacteria bacterium]|nr:hypothetical protein [Kofleriaceae bacterium]